MCRSGETWQEQAAAEFVWVLYKLLLNVKANSYLLISTVTLDFEHPQKLWDIGVFSLVLNCLCVAFLSEN